VIIFLPFNIANKIINNVVNINLIKISSYFVLRKCFRVAVITNFSPDKISKSVIIGIIPHFFLNLLAGGILFLYNDISRIDDLVQLKIPKFILI